MSLMEKMIDIPAEHMANVFGQFDMHMKKVERAFGVTIVLRENTLKLMGKDADVKRASRVFAQLFELSKRGNQITEQNVDYAISLTFEEREAAIVEIDKELICQASKAKNFRTKAICGSDSQ